MITLLLAIGSLEAIPIRISAFELTRPLRLSANTSDIQLIKAHNRFLMRSYWSDMARVFAVYISCVALGGGMLLWYAEKYTLVGSYTFNSELNLYHFCRSFPLPLSTFIFLFSFESLRYCVFAFGYCGFVLGCYNSLYISRYMSYIALSLAASTVIGVIIGVIISDVIKNSDASATGLVVGGWVYFVLTMRKVMSLGHFGRGNFPSLFLLSPYVLLCKSH